MEWNKFILLPHSLVLLIPEDSMILLLYCLWKERQHRNLNHNEIDTFHLLWYIRMYLLTFHFNGFSVSYTSFQPNDFWGLIYEFQQNIKTEGFTENFNNFIFFFQGTKPRRLFKWRLDYIFTGFSKHRETSSGIISVHGW